MANTTDPILVPSPIKDLRDRANLVEDYAYGKKYTFSFKNCFDRAVTFQKLDRNGFTVKVYTYDLNHQPSGYYLSHGEDFYIMY